jgi:predicted kinase
MRLYLLCGLPGAGKTTRARQIVDGAGALHLCPDEWLVGLGMSLVDYEFRFKLQDCMLVHAERQLQIGVSVIVEFGSWSRRERAAIRQVAVGVHARTELHFLHAPLDELARRVRARGGPEAEALTSDVLLRQHANFEQPSPEEIAQFDHYVGPGSEWHPA